jgi:hypothetical protein
MQFFPEIFKLSLPTSRKLRGVPVALAAALLFATASLFSCGGNRANPAPKAPPPPPFEYAGSWGEKGDGPGKLDAANAFTTDALGNVFFADAGGGYIHKFESTGTPLLSFEDARVKHTAGIAVDSGGAIYAANAQLGDILIFFPDGTFLRSWRFAPQRHFTGTLGMSTDEQGNLYIPDPAASRVLKFDFRGRIVKSWATPKEPAQKDERPSSVAVTPDGSIFVAYFSTGRVEKFSSDGSWVTSWNASANAGDATSPKSSGSPAASITTASAAPTSVPESPKTISGFAVSPGFAFTLAPSSPDIRVWTADGKPFLTANLGTDVAAIAAPQVAVTPHSELLVFDPAASRVFRFRMHLENKESK